MQKERDNRFHFILVDDNEIDLFFHDKLIKLQGLGTDVSSFSNVIPALEYLNSFKTKEQIYPETVILLDIQMPELDGFDFLDHFEQLPEAIQQKTTIFIVSSSLDHGDLSRSQANHLIDHILKKPLDAGELKAALASIHRK
jgi:CheY-like chemotaxis protein